MGLYLFLWSLLPICLAGLGTGIAASTANGESNTLLAAGIGVLVILTTIPLWVSAYAYSMAPFLSIDRPGLGAFAAVSESIQLMRGLKWRLFLFHLSFIGWFLLVVLTFGLAAFWVFPYVQISTASFYRSLVAPRTATP
jgi:uncharacterized membrane protein